MIPIINYNHIIHIRTIKDWLEFHQYDEMELNDEVFQKADIELLPYFEQLKDNIAQYVCQQTLLCLISTKHNIEYVQKLIIINAITKEHQGLRLSKLNQHLYLIDKYSTLHDYVIDTYNKNDMLLESNISDDEIHNNNITSYGIDECGDHMYFKHHKEIWGLISSKFDPYSYWSKAIKNPHTVMIRLAIREICINHLVALESE